MKAQQFSTAVFLFVCTVLNAQLTLDSVGKASLGKNHLLDNGYLKIGNDGVTQGLSIYDPQTGGSDFRIYRMGNIAYLTRGGNHSYGLRINSTGSVSVGVNSSNNYTSFASQFTVYADDRSTIGSRAIHSSDYGDSFRSQVSRPLSVTYAGWYDNQRTFYVLGNGELYSNGQYITSDISTKENITTISSSLDKVLKLRGVTFDSKFANKEDIVVSKNNEEDTHIAPEIAKQMNSEKIRKRMGVVAQEVEKVVPEAVRTTHTGTKAVAYAELVGLLIEAIKEQTGIISAQGTKIKELETLVNNGSKMIDIPVLKSATETAGIEQVTQNETANAFLYQNAPNPFQVKTEIRYFLPQTLQQAYICIFDMQGKMLKKLDASAGDNILTIQGSELQAGMYLYSLIADGKEVDTKRMILTK
jgi:hypothetical protein